MSPTSRQQQNSWYVLGNELFFFGFNIINKYSVRALVVALEEFAFLTGLIFSTGRGHWLVARKCNVKKKSKGVVEAPAEGQESPKKVSFEVRGKKRSQRGNQEDIPGRMLDQAFLVRVKASWNGWLVSVLVGGKDLPDSPLVQLPPTTPSD